MPERETTSGRHQRHMHLPVSTHRQGDEHAQTELLALAAHQITDARLADSTATKTRLQICRLLSVTLAASFLYELKPVV